MSMNQTPASERVHIGFFGRRNAGKSSVMNAVTGQDLAVVSDVRGTTTDPVYKSMELLPLGPVVMSRGSMMKGNWALCGCERAIRCSTKQTQQCWSLTGQSELHLRIWRFWNGSGKRISPVSSR